MDIWYLVISILASPYIRSGLFNASSIATPFHHIHYSKIFPYFCVPYAISQRLYFCNCCLFCSSCFAFYDGLRLKLRFGCAVLPILFWLAFLVAVYYLLYQSLLFCFQCSCIRRTLANPFVYLEPISSNPLFYNPQFLCSLL